MQRLAQVMTGGCQHPRSCLGRLLCELHGGADIGIALFQVAYQAVAVVADEYRAQQ